MLTLNEAIELGIKNSKQLKLSQARIDEAVAATKQATEARLPDASISGSYLRLTEPHISLKGAGSDTTGGFAAPPVLTRHYMVRQMFLCQFMQVQKLNMALNQPNILNRQQGLMLKMIKKQ